MEPTYYQTEMGETSRNVHNFSSSFPLQSIGHLGQQFSQQQHQQIALPHSNPSLHTFFAERMSNLLLQSDATPIRLNSHQFPHPVRIASSQTKRRISRFHPSKSRHSGTTNTTTHTLDSNVASASASASAYYPPQMSMPTDVSRGVNPNPDPNMYTGPQQQPYVLATPLNFYYYSPEAEIVRLGQNLSTSVANRSHGYGGPSIRGRHITQTNNQSKAKSSSHTS